MHAVRVAASPPVVKEPAGHVVQLVASAALYLSSAPHAVLALPPGQWYPAGHGVHVVRVLLSPPPVYEPGGHVSQMLLPAALYT